MTLLPPGDGSSLHICIKEEIWYIVCDRGFVIVGEEKIAVERDMLTYVPPTKKHQLINTGEVTLRAHHR